MQLTSINLSGYLLLVLISQVASLLNYVLAPIIVLFASKDGWLPKWLSWFQTPDNALDGDNGWKTEHRPFKDETNKFKQYINRIGWLYRNSMYGFAIDVLGAKILDTDILVIVGDPQVSNRPLTEGVVKRYILRDGQIVYWQWYYVKAWSKTRCIRINLGWKLWNHAPNTNSKGQLVFAPSFTMGYSL